MLPSVHEEFKQLEIKSVDISRESNLKNSRKARRSGTQADEASNELKQKVSKMMSNHT